MIWIFLSFWSHPSRDPSDSQFPLDLNGDGDVNSQDVDHWLSEFANTKRGDLDLNGRVDFADFLKLSGSYGLLTARHRDGDLTGDEWVDFDDFLILSANFGFDNTKA